MERIAKRIDKVINRRQQGTEIGNMANEGLMETLILVAIVGYLACAIPTAVVASNKGRRGFLWFILGVFLGPIALIIVLVIPDSPITFQKALLGFKDAQLMKSHLLMNEGMKKCPFCAEFVTSEAVLCRYCESELSSKETPEEEIIELNNDIDTGFGLDEIVPDLGPGLVSKRYPN